MIDVYGELAEPSRRLILAELRGGPKTVSELVSATSLKQPNVSNHLAKMRSRGTVKSTKVGRQVYYTLSSAQVHAVVVTAFVETPGADVKDLDAAAGVYAQLAADGDEVRCIRLIDQAVSDGHGLYSIYQDLLTPALATISSWQDSGRIDRAQERIAHTITERSVGRAAHMTAPKKRSEGSAIIGCCEGNWQTLDLRMLGEYVRNLGWRIYSLGASSPEDVFLSACRRHQPNLVLVGCNDKQAVQRSSNLIAGLCQVDGDHHVGVMGRLEDGEAQIAMQMGAAFHVRDLRDFTQRCLPLFDGISNR